MNLTIPDPYLNDVPPTVATCSVQGCDASARLILLAITGLVQPVCEEHQSVIRGTTTFMGNA